MAKKEGMDHEKAKASKKKITSLYRRIKVEIVFKAIS